MNHQRQGLVPAKEADFFLGIGKTTRCQRLDPKHKNHDPDFPRPVRIGRKTLFDTVELFEYKEWLKVKRDMEEVCKRSAISPTPRAAIARKEH